MRKHHRPIPVAHLDGQDDRPDPAQLAELAHAAAALLVYGNADGGPDAVGEEARAQRDDEATARFVRLADEIGLEAIAEVWSTAPAISLPGVLWRLYAMREWIVRNPREAADEYSTGRQTSRAEGWGSRVRVDPYLAELIAGIEDPPGPDEVVRAADEILAGAFRGDFTIALLRAAAFAEVAAAGRWELGRRTESRAFEQLANDLVSSARSHRVNELM